MKNKYIRYEISARKYSSNIIKGIYLCSDNKTEKYDIVLMSGLNKEEGDSFIETQFNLISKL